MDDKSVNILSQYEYVRDINHEHGVSLVMSKATGEYCVRKVTAVYNREVYEYIRCNPVPGVPAVKELIEDGDKLIIIEEYIPGVTLYERLKVHGPMSENDVITVIIRLLDILVSFHQNYPPIVHRDIKPSNIILGNNDSVWLIDFNAAKFADSAKKQDTELIGTRGYAAPEQYGFGSSTERTDVYAIGMLMREMLDSGGQQVVSPNLLNVINRCTVLEPSDRYEDAYSLRKALNAVKYSLENADKEPPNSNQPNAAATKKRADSSTPLKPDKRRIRKSSLFLIALVGIIVIASVVSAITSLIKLYKPVYDDIAESGFDYTNKPYGTLVDEDGSAVDMNGDIYTYMANEWNLYTATMISESTVKVTLWNRTASSKSKMEHERDLGIYDFEDSDSEVSWIDDEKTAFSLDIDLKPEHEYYDTTEELIDIKAYMRRAVFLKNTINHGRLNISFYNKDTECYRFKADSYYVYRAIPLSNGLIKIEKWKNASDYFAEEYYYDLTTVNPDSDELSFEWIDSDKASFTIKTHDPENKEWLEDKKVLFEKK